MDVFRRLLLLLLEGVLHYPTRCVRRPVSAPEERSWGLFLLPMLLLLLLLLLLRLVLVLVLVLRTWRLALPRRAISDRRGRCCRLASAKPSKPSFFLLFETCRNSRTVSTVSQSTNTSGSKKASWRAGDASEASPTFHAGLWRRK